MSDKVDQLHADIEAGVAALLGGDDHRPVTGSWHHTSGAPAGGEGANR
jgi:hypothetical protein